MLKNLPKRYDPPGKNTPMEYPAFISRAEMQHLRMHGGSGKRTKWGVPSFFMEGSESGNLKDAKPSDTKTTTASKTSSSGNPADKASGINSIGSAGGNQGTSSVFKSDSNSKSSENPADKAIGLLNSGGSGGGNPGMGLSRLPQSTTTASPLMKEAERHYNAQQIAAQLSQYRSPPSVTAPASSFPARPDVIAPNSFNGFEDLTSAAYDRARIGTEDLTKAAYDKANKPVPVSGNGIVPNAGTQGQYLPANNISSGKYLAENFGNDVFPGYSGPKGVGQLNDEARLAAARAQGYTGGLTKPSQADIDALSRMLMAESGSIRNPKGNMSIPGATAVGSVIANRIASPSYPNTLQGVLTQKNQFSPSQAQLAAMKPDYAINDVARAILSGEQQSNVGSSLNYGNLDTIMNKPGYSSQATKNAFGSMQPVATFADAKNPTAFQQSFGTIGQPAATVMAGTRPAQTPIQQAETPNQPAAAPRTGNGYSLLATAAVSGIEALRNFQVPDIIGGLNSAASNVAKYANSWAPGVVKNYAVASKASEAIAAAQQAVAGWQKGILSQVAAAEALQKAAEATKQVEVASAPNTGQFAPTGRPTLASTGMAGLPAAPTLQQQMDATNPDAPPQVDLYRNQIANMLGGGSDGNRKNPVPTIPQQPVVVAQGPTFSWVQWAPGQQPQQVPNSALIQGMS